MPAAGDKSEFATYLAEVLEPFGSINVRRMFGGYGVYHNGVMFGLIADEVLYLKADAACARAYEDKGLERFVYFKKGKPVKLSYYTAPEEIYEDPEAAMYWAGLAYAASMRRAGAVPGRRKRT